MPFLLVFLASIVGSPHCAAMCGGFVAVASHSDRSIQNQSAYHLGRLCTYLVLGAIAGALGTALDQLGLAVGISRAAVILTGAILIANGVTMLAGASPKVHHIFPFDRIFSLHQRLLTRYAGRRYFPFALGLFSTLLPCGWLYSYVIIAAGTGSLWPAMLTMFCFWAGTVPILATIGSLSHLVAGPLKRYAPVLIACLLIGAGILSIAGHLNVGPLKHGGMGAACGVQDEHGMHASAPF